MSENEDSRNPADQSRDGTRAYGHAIRHVSEGRDLLAPGSVTRDAVPDNMNQALRKSLLTQLQHPQAFDWVASPVKPGDIAAAEPGYPTFTPKQTVYASFIKLAPQHFEAAATMGKGEEAVVKNFRILMRTLVSPNAPLAITYQENMRTALVVTDSEGLAELRSRTQPQRGVRI